MAQQNLNVGTTSNDGTGDTLRNAFIKTQDNFTELYTSKQDTLVSGTNIKSLNGSSILGSGDLAVGGGINYTRHTSAVTAADKSGIIADTSAGSFTVTLPASPSIGAQVSIVDGADWSVNNLTVARNGSTIEDLEDDLIMDIRSVAAHFIYDGTTWEIFIHAGIASGNGVTLDGVETLTNKTITGALLNGETAVVVDSTSDALRITQTGTGNALVVEDSASPDSTPFVIDAAGRTVIGDTSARTLGKGRVAQFQVNGLATANASVAASAWGSGVQPELNLSRSRSTTFGALSSVLSGDGLGELFFAGDDGSAFVSAASITAAVDATPGTGSMPGRLVFSTTPSGSSTPTERMRIDSAGNVGIGTSSPASKLHVRSDADALTVIGQIQNRNTGASAGGLIAFINSGTDITDNRYSYIGAVTTGSSQNGNNLVFATNPNGGAPVERLRIDSAGTVQINNVTVGAALLNFATERSWQFEQVSTGSTAGLLLRCTVDAKSFSITSSDRANGVVISNSTTGSKLGVNTVPNAALSATLEVNGTGNFSSNLTVGGTLAVSGTTNTAGHFNAGTTAPTATNRLNYAGYLYATRFYGDGSQLTNVYSPISQSTSTTIISSDKGKHINATTGRTINSSTGFAIGDAVTIYNNSAGNITLTATGVTLRLAGTATTGNRTIATRGLVTILCVASNDYVISGAGLS